MNNPTVTDDLAYVRDLAEAGQQAPLLGGRFLAWWGGIITLAYAGHYAIASGILAVGNMAYAYLWGGFISIGLVGYFALIKTMSRDKPGQSSAGNKVEANVWMIAGFTLFANFGTLIVMGVFGMESTSGFESSLPIVFTAYGIALFTSGAMAENKVLTTAGLGALLIIALSVWFEGTDFIWAIAALGAFLTVFVPGLLLLKHEPKNVV
ncbi:MAG: hypothetical protein AAFR74_04305 [Pseudomonadota bacterium]